MPSVVYSIYNKNTYDIALHSLLLSFVFLGQFLTDTKDHHDVDKLTLCASMGGGGGGQKGR